MRRRVRPSTVRRRLGDNLIRLHGRRHDELGLSLLFELGGGATRGGKLG